MANLQDFIITGSLNLKESTPAVNTTGSVWYDVSSGRLQYSTYGGTWSAGGAMITARYFVVGAGTQNEGLAFGGYNPACGPAAASRTLTCTEEYNGSSWSSGGGLITVRRFHAGAGTQNAGLAFGGNSYPNISCTEEYDGSTWSSGGALITARREFAGAGLQNEALGFGGAVPPVFGVTCTEEYNGTSWGSGGTLITGRRFHAGAGSQNAGLAFGGGYPTFLSCTEEYNGTSWTAGGALITARRYLAGAGTQNAGLAFGGFCTPAILACTEEYNGTSWTAGGALITANYIQGGAGTQTCGLSFGGYNPACGPSAATRTLTCTEEYNPQTITVTL